ncbi:MAG: asparagine synthase (glutamine-hydrolyzing) [Lewinellaceae bacterium]|nr:asparagine synthase (glutamine-hydrolyzing) [Lewinellaceae bacterium]
MCGILGIVHIKNGKSPDISNLIYATELIHHRGPDDEGYLLWQKGIPEVFAGRNTAQSSLTQLNLKSIKPQPWRIAMSHKRLSIIDLSPQGHQPMFEEKSGIAISFNGEIYNYLELRQELLELGHSFHSNSDTEVLLKAWLEWGEACLNRLNGMFAFLILDPRGEGNFYAVRDRFGIKPLYYAEMANCIAIGSEIKQLKPFLKSLSPNEELINNFLANGATEQSGGSFFSEIKKVEGGCLLKIQLGSRIHLEQKRWYTANIKPYMGGLKQAAETFREILFDSVRLRMRSDVPLGFCLSGGLDSSSIVCAAKNLLEEYGHSNQLITITSSFTHKAFDEWHFAQQVVQKAGTRAIQVWPAAKELEEIIEKVIWHMDEPFTSTSIFSQWKVFQGAKEAGLKVMLDGQGADEQLAGYSGNEFFLYRDKIRQLNFISLFQDLTANSFVPPKVRLYHLMQAANSVINQKKTVRKPPPYLRKAPAMFGSAPNSFHENLLRQIQFSPLPSLLKNEDRNSMAFSIESRVPFLDYRLVEFVLSLPPEFIFYKGERKRVLRESMKGTLPEPIRKRQDKMGFVSPEEIWLKNDAKPWFQKQFKSALNILRNYLVAEEAEKQFDEIVNGRYSFSNFPFQAICLSIWFRQNF